MAELARQYHQSGPTGYAALRTISSLFRTLGWVVLVGGVLLSLAFAVGATARTGDVATGIFEVVVFVFGGLASVIAGLVLFAFADVITLLLNIEANTRRTLKVVERDE